MRSPLIHELPAPPPGRTGWPWTEGTEPAPTAMPNGRPWPRISVTTPSFQQGRYLEETIRSVLLQGYPDLEYFVIDGGSTDGSVAVLERYARWLTFWSSEPDRGSSEAVNRGWGRSTGAILAYLNSDDVYSPGAFVTAAAGLEDPPGADLVYSDCLVIDEESVVRDAMRGVEFDIAKQMLNNLVPQPTIFVRSEVVRAEGPLDPELQYTHDHEFCARVGARHRLRRLPCCLGRFRLQAAGKTANRADEFYAEWVANLDKAARQEPLRRYVPARPIERRGLATYNAAILCYGSGDTRAALARFMTAARLYPGLAGHIGFWRHVVKCAAGQATMRRLRIWRQRHFGPEPAQGRS